MYNMCMCNHLPRSGIRRVRSYKEVVLLVGNKVHASEIHGLVAAVEADVAFFCFSRVARWSDHQPLDVIKDALVLGVRVGHRAVWFVEYLLRLFKSKLYISYVAVFVAFSNLLVAVYTQYLVVGPLLGRAVLQFKLIHFEQANCWRHLYGWAQWCWFYFNFYYCSVQ